MELRKSFIFEDDPASKPVRVCGFKIRIEYPSGSMKVKRNDAGKVLWTRKFKNDYGYLVGVEGADGDSLDCFVCPPDCRVEDGEVHVVHQLKIGGSGEFDEDKVFIGYPSKRDAIEAYKAHCHDFDNLYGGVSTFSVDDFVNEYEADYENQDEDFDSLSDFDANGMSAAVGGCPVSVSGTLDTDGDPADFATFLLATGYELFPRPPETKDDQAYEASGPGFRLRGKKSEIEAKVASLPESIKRKTTVKLLAENLMAGELSDIVSKRVSIDEYVAKDGGDNVVVAFFVMGASTAVEPLRAFCEASPHVVLADSGDSDTQKRVSIVYCEIERATITAGMIKALIADVCRVASINIKDIELAFPGSGNNLFPFSDSALEAFASKARMLKKAPEPSAVAEGLWFSPTGSLRRGPASGKIANELFETGWTKITIDDLIDESVLTLQGASMTGATLAARKAVKLLRLPLRAIVLEKDRKIGARRSVFESLTALEAVAESRRWNKSSRSTRRQAAGI